MTGTEAGGGESISLTYDINGNMITRTIDGLTTQLYYNWDNKLRSAAVTDADTVDIVYDPDGNRVSRTVTGPDDRTTKRKYIVDIAGSLPVILAEIDTNTGSLKRSYIYAGPQPIAFCNGDWRAAGARYYYLHDREK